MNTLFKFLSLSCVISWASTASTQTYEAIDLASPAGAVGLQGNRVAGYQNVNVGTGVTRRATLWEGAGLVDLHPSFVQSSAYSCVLGASGSLQVGVASDPLLGGLFSAVRWHGTSASAERLTFPFEAMASYATGTDGTQIVGYGYPGDPETTFFDDARAVVWNAQTGAPTDLGGSNPTFALGVGGAQQVGYEMRGSAEACMWTGTARSLVSLHPRNADASQALATDGVHQVGFASVDVRVFTERRGGRTRVRFNYAYMWNGTKDSAVMLDSFEYGSTVATGISGETACGFGTLTSRTGSYLGYRALAWVGADYHRVELHNLLPQTYISSRALGLDAAGNIVGEAQDAAGTMHAILWRKLTP